MLGLALVATGAIVMAQRSQGLGLGLVGGGFVLVVVGALLTAPKRAKAGGEPPAGGV
jgi:hypothetical protein